MRIVLLTTGSMGDVQPFISLGIRLYQAGHRVRIAAPENARNLCRSCGLEFTAIDSDTQSRLRTESRQVRMDSGSTWSFTMQRLKTRRSIALNVNRSAWWACQDADLIVYRIGGFLYGDSIAEKLDIPYIRVGLVPYTPTKAFPSLYFSPVLELGGLGNWISHKLAAQIIWIYMHQVVNELRQNVLGLQPYPVSRGYPKGFLNQPDDSTNPVLYAFSQALLPKPSDWCENVHVTGHWSSPLEGEWQPPEDLIRFLDSGEPPVFLGFGSMISLDLKETFDVARTALEASQQRGIIAGGWSGTQIQGRYNDQIYLIENAPHEWLFPRTKATVHHGGVGTTLNSLKAGVPPIVIPFNYDQPFWGRQVAKLGAGPKPVPRKQLTAEKLAQAIVISLEDTDIRSKVNQISSQIKAEDGTGYTLRIIEDIQTESTKKGRKISNIL